MTNIPTGGLIPRRRCNDCNGRGVVDVKDTQGRVTQQETCKTCSGYGSMLQMEQVKTGMEE